MGHRVWRNVVQLPYERKMKGLHLSLILSVTSEILILRCNGRFTAGLPLFLLSRQLFLQQSCNHNELKGTEAQYEGHT